jgi:hypothetical protein
MEIDISYRDLSQPIIWEGNLNDDCTAKWAGLMLRAEWMDENYWWWCVYDMIKDEIQIDSSNEYNERFICGKVSREKAEEIAKKYLKSEIINGNLNSSNFEISNYITYLKKLGASPVETIQFLKNKFNISLSKAKDLVFDSNDWLGLRDASEKLTQEFINAGAEIADKVEYIDGKVTSITFDLTKGNLKSGQKNKTFWNKIKSKFI